MSRRAIFIIILTIVVAIIVGLIINAFVPRASLIMSIAPEEFTVTINGHTQKVKTGESITVTPGDISIDISSNGFGTLKQKISIKNGEEKEVLAALAPQTEEAKRLLETEKSQEIIQRITNVSMEKASKQLLKAYPILAVLPINDKFYTITSCPSQTHLNDPTKIAVCVNLYDLQAKQSAVEEVIRKGFNLDNYETYFVDESYDPLEQAGH